MRLAGVLVAVGALMMLAKGLLLIATDNDRSLVPWFGLFTAFGFTAAAIALWRSTTRLRWLSAVGGALALVGVIGSLVAIIYLVTGTIPESENAPAAVGASYIALSAGSFLALLALGIVIAANRSLAGRWRWRLIGCPVPDLHHRWCRRRIDRLRDRDRRARPRPHRSGLDTPRLRPHAPTHLIQLAHIGTYGRLLGVEGVLAPLDSGWRARGSRGLPRT